MSRDENRAQGQKTGWNGMLRTMKPEYYRIRPNYQELPGGTDEETRLCFLYRAVQNSEQRGISYHSQLVPGKIHPVLFEMNMKHLTNLSGYDWLKDMLTY